MSLYNHKKPFLISFYETLKQSIPILKALEFVDSLYFDPDYV